MVLTEEKSIKGHKADIVPLAQQLRLQLFDNIGKYRVFSMNYHFFASKELLAVKGVYWNKQQKVYMAMRGRAVKEKVEKNASGGRVFPDRLS